MGQVSAHQTRRFFFSHLLKESVEKNVKLKLEPKIVALFQATFEFWSISDSNFWFVFLSLNVGGNVCMDVCLCV